MKTYTTKSNANRAAKAAGYNLEDVTILEIDGRFGFKPKHSLDLPLEEKVAEPVVTEPEVEEEVVAGFTYCPHCNIHLSNGYNTDPEENSNVIYCLACNGALTDGNKNKSVIENPVKAVWEIADQHWGMKRSEVIKLCVEAGIAYNTARTQYQAFYKVKKAEEAK